MTEKPEIYPAFWNEYTPPKSNVASLVQMPIYRIDGFSLSNAYMRDARAEKVSARQIERKNLALYGNSHPDIKIVKS